MAKTKKRAAAVVTGQDSLAPGLMAARVGGSPLVATQCPAPSDGQWFSALGGEFEHTSEIELVNPDRGVAVADLVIHTPNGIARAPELRGISIPGRSVRRVDLAQELPRTSLMSLVVAVSRGRVSVGVADELSRIGGSRPIKEWIPAQSAASEKLVLLGMVAGTGDRTLVLSNPGDDEIQVQVQVVNDRSTFTPTDWSEVRVPPGALRTVSLDGLGEQIRQGALGLQITASAPVVAGLRQLVGGDVSHLAAADAFEGDARALLPGGKARLVLGDAAAEGSVRVMATSADGTRLLRTQVDVAPARSIEVALPRRTASVTATADGTSVTGVVVLEEPGHAVLPLVTPRERGAVPAVRPALR